MRAINDYIIIDKIKKSVKDTVEENDGLIMGEIVNSDIRYLKAEVVSASAATEIKAGSEVYFDKHAAKGNEIFFKGKTYNIIKLRDIVLIDEDNAR